MAQTLPAAEAGDRLDAAGFPDGRVGGEPADLQGLLEARRAAERQAQLGVSQRDARQVHEQDDVVVGVVGEPGRGVLADDRDECAGRGVGDRVGDQAVVRFEGVESLLTSPKRSEPP